MQEPRTGLRRYYQKLWRQFLRELFKRGSQQAIGGLLAFAILVAQLHYGLISQGTIWFQVYSIGWPYLLLIAALCIWSAAKAPVSLDNERQDQLNEANDKIALLQIELIQIQASTAKPPHTPSQQHYYDKTKAILADGDEETIEILRYLHRAKKVSAGAELVHMAKGDSANRYNILKRLTDEGLITLIRGNGRTPDAWQLPEIMNSVLDELLY